MRLVPRFLPAQVGFVACKYNENLYPNNVAEPTGFEPATSSVTGKRSNQLSYGSKDR